MKTPPKRPARPSIERLEGRRLLNGSPSATWVGQDQNDLVGRSSNLGPSGIQDVHIALADLPTDRAIARANVQGYGGGQWLYNGDYGPWAAALVRDAGATTAGLFVEPYQVETGRSFSIDLTYDDGTTTYIEFAGGAADPNLRMPDAAATATWIGQDGADRVGRGPSVGPDGALDAVIALSNLGVTAEIDRVSITGPDALAWQSGVNAAALPNAELIRSAGDPTEGLLYVQPDRDLAGKALVVQIVYADGTTDQVVVAAGRTDPSRQVPTPPAPAIRAAAIAAAWTGQSTSTGDVGVRVTGLPADRSIVAATLTNEVRAATWLYKADPRIDYYSEPDAKPLSFNRGVDSTTAALAFAPIRDEAGSILTVRLTYDDGTMSIARFAGGAADVSLRAPMPAATEVQAQPGDDLQSLVDRFGTVRLAAGTYRLTRPLVLNRPVNLVGEAGATLLFAQPAGAPTWTAAIKIHHGNTTLDAFRVRFEGTVRWNWAVPYDPAVIGTTDPFDPTAGGLKTNLQFKNLDLQGPAVAPGATPVESPKLLRLVTAEDGTISGNRLRGGTVEVQGGPWRIVGNTYRGAIAGTRVFDVFAAHQSHDLVVRDNVARPESGSGKTYRFLVMTGSGDGDLVSDNVVEGIGPRDDDTVEQPNAPETILTEAYRIRFEGRPLAVSTDGRVVQIPPPQGEAVRSGDVLAVLSGPNAGQWRRVSQVIDARTLLLESPLPTDAPIAAVSVTTGFVDLAIRGNVIDDRGSRVAAPLVLVGGQFGTEVRNNRFRGGYGSRVVAMPSEAPVHWGWSRTPALDVTIAGNTFEDAVAPLTIGVDRNAQTKSSKDRVYFEGDLTGNVVAWSSGFLNGDAGPVAFRVGHVRALDPFETRVHASGNRARVPAGRVATVEVHVATYNDQEIVDASFNLPSVVPDAPTGLRLFNDSGASASDGLTNDARFLVDRLPDLSYQYKLDGWDDYRPFVAAPGQPETPPGVADGPVTLWVRAVDAFDEPGVAVPLRFTYDATPPAAAVPVLSSTSDTGVSSSDRITANRQPTFVIQAAAGDSVALLSDGQIVGRRDGPGPLAPAAPLREGTQTIATLVTDAAGNVAISGPLMVTIDSTPPGTVPGLSDLGNGNVRFSPLPDALAYEYRVGNGAYVALGAATAFRAAGLDFGANGVFVRATDAAGNVGPDAAVVVTLARPRPVWVGQASRADLAGPWSDRIGRDGFADIQIGLADLPTDRELAFVDVFGQGAGRWQFNNPANEHWRVALTRNPVSTAALLSFAAFRVEVSKQYQVDLRFSDGTGLTLYLQGGRVDPKLKAGSRGGAPAPAASNRPNPLRRRWPRFPKA